MGDAGSGTSIGAGCGRCFRQDFGGFGEHFAGGGDGGDVVGLDGGLFCVRFDGGRSRGYGCGRFGRDLNFGGRLEDGRALAELAARQRVDAVGGRGGLAARTRLPGAGLAPAATALRCRGCWQLQAQGFP